MNKCEMIEDKEQIARIIAFELCPYKYHKEWWGENAKCYSDNNFGDCTKIKEVVDKLYNAGYRKVTEDEIVESMKTYERSREETAREILKEIRQMDGFSCDYDIDDIVWKIAKKYGIELED